MPTTTNAKPKRSWRRWVTYSIRGMIVLMSVIAAWCAYLYQFEIVPAREQRRAVEAIVASGGYFDFSDGSSSLRRKSDLEKSALHQQLGAWWSQLLGEDVDLRVIQADIGDRSARWLPLQNGGVPPRKPDAALISGDANLQHVARLRGLKALFACGETVTDSGLRHVADMETLEWLKLARSGVRGPGLADLYTLTRLNSLTLTFTPLGDDGMAYFPPLPALSSLDLMHTGITDAGLERLQGLPSLQTLNLAENEITGTGLHWLTGLQNLEVLNLACTPLDDSGIQALTQLPKLRSLNISKTKVTDAGLALLANCPNLQYVQVTDGDYGKVTQLGAANLRKSNAQINLAFGAPPYNPAWLRAEWAARRNANPARRLPQQQQQFDQLDAPGR